MAGLLDVLGLMNGIVPTVKGAAGEMVVKILLKGLPGDEYRVVRNVMLQTERGTTQIDIVVVSVYGVFVIEVKNYEGRIVGGEYADQWTQILGKERHRFMNPIHQNYAHVKAVEALLKAKGLDAADGGAVPVYSIVTFPATCDVTVRGRRTPVCYWGYVPDTIRELSTRRVCDAERVNAILSALQEGNVDSLSARVEHRVQVKEKAQERQAKVEAGVCPRCGGRLVQRQGRYGAFLGCDNYPKCHFTAIA